LALLAYAELAQVGSVFGGLRLRALAELEWA
jgi:hypothetical protein